MRKPKKYHYIYKTTCKVTGKFYVGMHSTDNLDDGYIGSGKKLWYSIRKHGSENHEREILEFLPNRSSLKQREKEIVNEQFLEDPMCMNLQIGGGGGFISEEHMKKCSSAGNLAYKKRLENDPALLTRLRKRAELMRSARGSNYATFTFTGKTHTEETKQKMRESKKNHGSGEQNSQYGTCWITNGSENKKIKKVEDLPEGWTYGRKIKPSAGKKI